MTTHTVTISQVLHPGTGAVLAFEIVDNTGRVWFVAPPGAFWDGMHVGPFPSGADGTRLERVEIARLT